MSPENYAELKHERTHREERRKMRLVLTATGQRRNATLVPSGVRWNLHVKVIPVVNIRIVEPALKRAAMEPPLWFWIPRFDPKPKLRAPAFGCSLPGSCGGDPSPSLIGNRPYVVVFKPAPTS